MYYIHGLDTVEQVQAIKASILALLQQGSFTTEYTIGGTDVRKERIFRTKAELDLAKNDCDEFLIEELLGQPISRVSTPFLGI